MSGKWSQAGVPHKGWNCVYVEDLETPSMICEMCEAQEIRYVHHMEHASYAGTLHVGCVCAEHMEEDLVGPKQREQRLRNAGARRKRWLTRNWRTSAKGNDYLNVEGFNIVIYRAGAAWSFRIKAIVDGQAWTPTRRVYATEDAAKLAAFDAFVFLRNS